MNNQRDFHDAALRPTHTYRRNPLFAQSFQIFRKRSGDTLSPCATYMVIDAEEDPALSERKVMNLVSILNGRTRLLDLGRGTGVRTLYHVPPRARPDQGQRVVFYTLHPKGVSQENALLVFEPDAELPVGRLSEEEGPQGHD